MAATQASLGGRRDGAWDRPRPSVAYATQQPSSPTLTNPDMILPDYDHGDAYDALSHASSSVWSVANDDFSSLSQNPHAMPLGPTTPIIYGNGTMLSDIGEVTEVESVASSPPRCMTARVVIPPIVNPRSTPIIGKPLVARRPLNERRLSIESTSTVNDGPRLAALGDIDDSISIADSCFQGDDEESMTSSYIEEIPIRQPMTTVRPTLQSIPQSKANANSISRRAEHILANAKRRLSTMEGNLNKARSFANSSTSECSSTPSPVARPVKSFDNALPKSPSRHSRNTSESGPQESERPVERFQRSASALGAAGGYRQPLLSPRSVDALGCHHLHSNGRLSHHPLDMALTPLSEGGDEHVGHYAGDRADDIRVGGITSPALGSFSDAGAPRSPRSPSLMQVRDLQDQMEGLKGKITNLRKQAREDSMKRRSLQGLRTPSPFTHARWDQKHVGTRSVSCQDHRNGATGSPLGCVPSESESSVRTAAVVEDAAQVVAREDTPSIAGSYHEARETQDQHGAEHAEAVEAFEAVEAIELQSEDGEYLDDAIDEDPSEQGAAREAVVKNGDALTDGWSESGDSMYHDTRQHPVSHEDREDAFDYEHFFLHSAMGTLSHQDLGRRDSSGSEESDDSVETTRGPGLVHGRHPSLDTFASVYSFTTATEGRGSRSSLMVEDFGDGRAAESTGDQYVDSDLSSVSDGSTDNASQWHGGRRRQNSVIHRPSSMTTTPSSTTTTLHRPSISSFESTGTNRSFPLVNKAGMSGGMLTPVSSPGHDFKQVADSLISETASICDRESIHEGQSPSPAIQMLSKEEQAMVEGVVASLGRCVLGLTETSETDPGRRDEFRRRIDAARKILEADTES